MVNREWFSHMVTCPKCGERVRAETASLMVADYWQDLDRERGMKWDIVPLRHDG